MTPTERRVLVAATAIELGVIRETNALAIIQQAIDRAYAAGYEQAVQNALAECDQVHDTTGNACSYLTARIRALLERKGTP